MSETAAEVTNEYAKQIIRAVLDNSGDDTAYLVRTLLREYGAKAYKQGREHFAADVARLVQS